MKKSIAVDMDNVLADVESHYIDWYERHYGVRVPKEALHGIPELEAFPDKTAVRKFLYTPGFFRTVPVMPGAQEGIRRLLKNFEVYIVSAAMEFPQSLSEKLEWLNEHFPEIGWRHIIFCGDKSVIDTDFMLDDHIKNLDYCKGKAVLFTASHNMKLERDCRVNSWPEAVAFLEAELAQKEN